MRRRWAAAGAELRRLQARNVGAMGGKEGAVEGGSMEELVKLRVLALEMEALMLEKTAAYDQMLAALEVGSPRLLTISRLTSQDKPHHCLLTLALIGSHSPMPPMNMAPT